MLLVELVRELIEFAGVLFKPVVVIACVYVLAMAVTGAGEEP